MPLTKSVGGSESSALREILALNACIRKKNPKSIILSFYLNKLEKEEWIKSKVNRREIMKIRAEINETENSKSIAKKIIIMMNTKDL